MKLNIAKPRYKNTTDHKPLKLNDCGNSYNVYFLTDLHLYHENITQNSNWENKSNNRDYKNATEMNMDIINSINGVVDGRDILFLLGDIIFGKNDADRNKNLLEFLSLINCKNIHLILGNHDKFIRDNKFIKNYGWVNNKLKYSEGFGVGVSPCYLFSSVSNLKEIVVNGQRITLCHYALAVWNQSHRGTWQLHGHSHGNYTAKGLQYDVCVENAIKAFGKPKPFSFEDIKYIMNNKTINIVDNHK